MIKSMTGFGRGEFTLNDRKFLVEIKSVNHKYNDVFIKLPRTMIIFEERIRKKVLSAISRGKIDVYINYESFSKEDISIKLNEPLADLYVKELNYIKDRYNLKDSVSLNVLTRFQDILSVENRADNEEKLWETLQQALEQAIANFLIMREVEGAALKKDLLIKADKINSLVLEIKIKAPDVVNLYREKLKQRIGEIYKDSEIDQNRLMLEIVLFADKSCVDEEIIRLLSHINQLKTFLNQKEPVGRKLDFLLQEMFREVNTIASKSNDLGITNLTVDLKSEVEKVREQIQNIE